jgi:hypothetical protein
MSIFIKVLFYRIKPRLLCANDLGCVYCYYLVTHTNKGFGLLNLQEDLYLAVIIIESPLQQIIKMFSKF